MVVFFFIFILRKSLSFQSQHFCQDGIVNFEEYPQSQYWIVFFLIFCCSLTLRETLVLSSLAFTDLYEGAKFVKLEKRVYQRKDSLRAFLQDDRAASHFGRKRPTGIWFSIDRKQKDEEINLKLLTEFSTWFPCIRSLSKNEMRFTPVLSSSPGHVWPTVVEYVLCARPSVWHMVWSILTWSSSWNNLCSYFLFFILELSEWRPWEIKSKPYG